MGNVLEHESALSRVQDADIIEEDLKWLAVSGATRKLPISFEQY